VTPPSVKPESDLPEDSASDASTPKDSSVESSVSASAESEATDSPETADPDDIPEGEEITSGVTRLRPAVTRKGAGLGLRGGARRGLAQVEGADGEEPIGLRGRGRGLGGGGLGGGGLGDGMGGRRPGMLARNRKAAAEGRLAHGQSADGNDVDDHEDHGAEDIAHHDAAGALVPEASAGGLTAPAASHVTTPQRTAVALDDEDDEDDLPVPVRRPGGKALGRPGKQGREGARASYIPAPAVQGAQMRRRHWGLVLFFVLLAVLPTASYSWYLYARAADQYESDIGFGSRTESAPSTFDFLGALGGVGASSSSDMDILNQFIVSQELVSRVDAKLDLRKIFSKPANDPLFSFPANGKIEDLVEYWKSMVIPTFDGSTGLMNIQVFAFDPQDAQNIAREVLSESTSIINELSKTAQDDSTRYSKEALIKVQEQMAGAQKNLTEFRIKNRIVDPSTQLAGATQVITSLVQQLGEAEIDLDMLRGTVPESDPRIAQLNRRIEVIQNRISEETSKVGGLSDPNSAGYAKLVSDYQNLQMEQDFASKAYLQALGAYDQAVNDAQHNTRYLATYLQPTLAESSTAPNRPLRIFLTALAGFLLWATLAMIYYALRDRR
jgi:capsular polysaccharide transport system permease protein